VPFPAAPRWLPPGRTARPVVLPAHAARLPARAGTAPADRLHARDLPIGVVIIDRRYDIRAINERARRLLAIYGPAIGEDFLHLLPEVPYAGLRAAIDRAFAEGVATSVPDLALDEAPRGRRLLQITCQRQPAATDGEADPVVVLIVSEAPAPGQPAAISALEPPASWRQAPVEDEAARLREVRLSQLLAANAKLVEANLALHADLEEALAVNHQLQIQAKEQQLFAEETETHNEELQATNEELESLNEELRSTIDELAAEDGRGQPASAPELLAGTQG
jgi:two-component system CheB/CheR fusion protein